MTNEDIYRLRVNLDTYARTIMATGPGMFEVEKCRQHLLRARRWLGKVADASGSDSPYPKARTPEQIPFEVDRLADEDLPLRSLGLNDLQEQLDHINHYRDVIASAIEGVKHAQGLPMNDRFKAIALTQVYVSLVDARMCLGMALGKIRDRYHNPKTGLGQIGDLPSRIASDPHIQVMEAPVDCYSKYTMGVDPYADNRDDEEPQRSADDWEPGMDPNA